MHPLSVKDQREGSCCKTYKAIINRYRPVPLKMRSERPRLAYKAVEADSWPSCLHLPSARLRQTIMSAQRMDLLIRKLRTLTEKRNWQNKSNLAAHVEEADAGLGIKWVAHCLPSKHEDWSSTPAQPKEKKINCGWTWCLLSKCFLPKYRTHTKK